VGKHAADLELVIILNKPSRRRISSPYARRPFLTPLMEKIA
jgi:hypothetical protein